MNIVLLSGGSGQRLWPLSNSIRSKQFIKIFENNGTYESMVQRMYRNILMVDNDAKITIATAEALLRPVVFAAVSIVFAIPIYACQSLYLRRFRKHQCNDS